MRTDIKFMNFLMRSLIKRNFIDGLSISALRRHDVKKQGFSETGGTRFLHIQSKTGGKDRLLIYLHGGAWVSGPGGNHISFSRRLADAAGADVFLVDYALAPEHDCLEAHSDVSAVYEHLLVSYPGHKIILAGDSAGAGLALAFAMSLRGSGRPAPSKLVLLSPWLDSSLSNEGITDEADKRDSVLSRSGLIAAGKMFAGSLPTHSPLLSPGFGRPEGLPPILILSGSAELFVYDCRDFYRRSRDAGVRVVYSEYPDMFHVWMLSPPYFPEAKQAFEEIVGFISSKA